MSAVLLSPNQLIQSSSADSTTFSFVFGFLFFLNLAFSNITVYLQLSLGQYKVVSTLDQFTQGLRSVGCAYLGSMEVPF